MDWKITRFEERLDRGEDGTIYRYKKAIFTVDGTKHTLKISMPDFDAGKAAALVEAEAKKISAVLQATGSGKSK